MKQNKSLEISKENCLLKINSLISNLKSAEFRFADYILNNADEAIKYTIHELVEKSGASYATIIRFCKKAGYDGFKDFKTNLIQDVIRIPKIDQSALGFPINQQDTSLTIRDRIFDSFKEALDETKKIFDKEAIDQAIEKILQARTILFIGTGTSGLSGNYAVSRFFRLGLNCISELDVTIYKQRLAIMGKNDLLFAISSSGRSINIVEAAKLAKNNNIPIISLCDYAISPLNEIADINIYTTPRNVNQYLDVELPRIVAQIGMIDILFAICSHKLDNKVIKYYTATKNAADKEKIS